MRAVDSRQFTVESKKPESRNGKNLTQRAQRAQKTTEKCYEKKKGRKDDTEAQRALRFAEGTGC